jgi:putative membrane protein
MPIPRHDIWSAWRADPFAAACVAVALLLYAAGLRASGVRAVSRARAASFMSGVAIALLATVSPLHAAADATFTGHMVQHLVLMLVAAPLVVAGRPALVASLALPLAVRRFGRTVARAQAFAAALRALRSPLVILLANAAALWTWHLPGPYQAAIRDEAVHAAEHASLLAAALAFWAGVLRAGPRRRIGSVPAMLLVAGTMLHSTWLAAILTFGGVSYPLYVQRAAAWGIDPLADQQLAGAIMWIPSAIVYVALAGVLFVRWFRELDALHDRRPAAVTTR